MDFSNHNAPHHSAGRSSSGYPGDKSSFNPLNWAQPAWLRVIFVVLLFSVAGLAVALALLLNGAGRPNENTYVNNAQYQSVFLANGQVYYGKIQRITKTYIDLQDVYYTSWTPVASNTTTTSTLVKLGCERHGPNDQMLINRDQVTFWENLKAGGQVTSDITKWQQDHPDGLECSGVSTTGQETSTTPLQASDMSNSGSSASATSTNGSSTSASGVATKKP